jgi:hypothetical protein
VASTVARGGRLLVRTAIRREVGPAPRRPWPLAPSEIRAFESNGMTELAREVEGEFAHISYQRG